MARQRDEATQNSVYELFIASCTILSLFVMVLLVIWPDDLFSPILLGVDTLFCLIFLVDFARRLIKAPVKREYLMWSGTLDLLGSIPEFPLLRILRVVRLARLARRMGSGGARGLAAEFIRRRAEAALYLTTLLAIVLLAIGSCLVLVAEEPAPTANIHSPQDALWWSYVTVATVGYGDRFPVTTLGRVVGMVLMTFGIGIFGVLTSFMSSVFLAPPKDEKGAPPDTVPDELRRLSEEVALLRAQIVALAAVDPGRPGSQEAGA